MAEALSIISYHAAHTDFCPLSPEALLFVKFAKSSTGLSLASWIPYLWLLRQPMLSGGILKSFTQNLSQSEDWPRQPLSPETWCHFHFIYLPQLSLTTQDPTPLGLKFKRKIIATWQKGQLGQGNNPELDTQVPLYLWLYFWRLQ